MRLSVRSRALILTFVGNQIRKAQAVSLNALYDTVTATSPPRDSVPRRETTHVPLVSTEIEAILGSLIVHDGDLGRLRVGKDDFPTQSACPIVKQD